MPIHLLYTPPTRHPFFLILYSLFCKTSTNLIVKVLSPKILFSRICRYLLRTVQQQPSLYHPEGVYGAICEPGLVCFRNHRSNRYKRRGALKAKHISLDSGRRSNANFYVILLSDIRSSSKAATELSNQPAGLQEGHHTKQE